jgi:DNA-binding NarL/FixJ family response regulator
MDDTAMDLSPREREVLAAMARGDSNRVIADALVLSEATVKNHVSNILTKLHADDRRSAVERGRSLGLIVSAPPA